MACQEKVTPGKVNNLISFFEGHGDEKAKSSMEIKQNHYASPSLKQNMVQDYFSNSETQWAKSEQVNIESRCVQNIHDEVVETCEEVLSENGNDSSLIELQKHQESPEPNDSNFVQSYNNDQYQNKNYTQIQRDNIESDKIQIVYQCQLSEEKEEIVKNIESEEPGIFQDDVEANGKEETLLYDINPKKIEIEDQTQSETIFSENNQQALDVSPKYTEMNQNFQESEEEKNQSFQTIKEEENQSFQSIKEEEIQSFQEGKGETRWFIPHEDLPNHLKGLRTPTIYPASYFDAEIDATALKKAMKGLGTDEKSVIEILTRRSLEQRVEIFHKFQQLYGKDLCEELKSELSGKFEQIILALMTPYFQYLAMELRRALKGLGTDEGALIEIICTCDDESIGLIKESYQQMYKTNLQDEIYEDTSGDFRKVLLSILAACREDPHSCSPEAVAGQLCQTDAKGKPALDSDTVRTVLVTYTREFLYGVFKEYENKTGKSFGDLIRQVCSGDTEAALLAVYESIVCTPKFYAQELYNAMKGVGTNDTQLIRIVVSRSEIDLEDIKENFLKLYNKPLDKEVKGETSGDYQTALLALIEGSNQRDSQHEQFDQDSQL